MIIGAASSNVLAFSSWMYVSLFTCLECIIGTHLRSSLIIPLFSNPMRIHVVYYSVCPQVQNVSDSRRFLQNWFPDITDKVDEQWNMQKDCSISYVTLHRQVHIHTYSTRTLPLYISWYYPLYGNTIQ
jgi:hypothetical protein